MLYDWKRPSQKHNTVNNHLANTMVSVVKMLCFPTAYSACNLSISRCKYSTLIATSGLREDVEVDFISEWLILGTEELEIPLTIERRLNAKLRRADWLRIKTANIQRRSDYVLPTSMETFFLSLTHIICCQSFSQTVEFHQFVVVIVLVMELMLLIVLTHLLILLLLLAVIYEGQIVDEQNAKYTETKDNIYWSQRWNNKAIDRSLWF